MKKKLLASFRGMMAVLLMLFATNLAPVASAYAFTSDNTGVNTESAVTTKAISAKALTDHECNDSEWHFVITSVASEQQAPASISVHFANGQTVVVSLSNYTGQTAHYTTTSNLDSTVTSATASIYTGWDGQFNLSHGPCEVETTSVTPATVTFTDLTCDENSEASYTIPSKTGVTYMVSVNGGTAVEKTANTYTVSAGDTVEVTAVAASSSYTLTGTTSWSHEFNDVEDGCGTTICHATGSTSNPFVKISPSAAGVYHGHLGASHQNGEDIIPTFTYKNHTYSQNWDTAGMAIFNNDCKVPTPQPTQVTPSVQFLNPTCENTSGRVTVTAVTGVTYKVNGTVVTGTTSYAAGSSVTVTAVLTSGYVLAGGASASFSHSFSATPTNCVLGETDVCPNLTGTQTTVPSGMVKDTTTGNCVTGGLGGGEVLGATTVATPTTSSATLVNTGESVWTNILVGVTVIAMAVGLTVASRKQFDS